MIDRGVRLALAAWCIASTSARAAEAPPPPKPLTLPAKIPTTAAPSVCATIAAAAKAHDLPFDYFARLIWRESRFQPNAMSPAGAQGVAQFMPTTAAERGLIDPFEVGDALMHSAAFLDTLRTTFGNLGLAAAAYNAGPARVSRWLAGQAQLPQETLAYVAAITGHDAQDWRAKPPPTLRSDKDFDCARYAATAGRIRDVAPLAASASGKPWAVILLGNPQRDRAMSEYRMVRVRFFGILGEIEPSLVHKRIAGMQVPSYVVQIERDTRGDADSLCARLMRAGGSCFVLANPG